MCINSIMHFPLFHQRSPPTKIMRKPVYKFFESGRRQLHLQEEGKVVENDDPHGHCIKGLR